MLSSPLHHPLWTDNLLAKPHERWTEFAERVHDTDTSKVLVRYRLTQSNIRSSRWARGW
ncbi:hypothetical protein [Nocardia sp. Marseille-Q1738]